MKIYRLLASLEKKELQQLQKFLKSEWVTGNPVYNKMLAYLLPYHPHFDEVNKNDFLHHLAGTEHKSIQYLYDRARELFQLTARFITLTALPKNPYLQQQLKLAAFKDKGLLTDFLDEANNAIQTYDQANIKHSENTYNCWFSYQQLQNYPAAAHLYMQKEGLGPTDALQKLDAYYLLVKLRHSCNVIAAGQYTGTMPQIPYLEETLAFAQNHYPDHFMIQAFRSLIMIYLDWEENTFHLLYDGFLAHHPDIEENDRLFILLSLVNLINRNIKVDEKRMQLMFRLFQEVTKSQLFSPQRPINDATFLNICTVGAILQKKEWTEAFINSHHQYLPDNYAKAALQLAKALLHFHSGEYNKALELCNTYPPKAYTYKSRIYFLRLRCLLELQLQDESYIYALKDYATAFRKYLQRNKKSIRCTQTKIPQQHHRYPKNSRGK